MRIENRKKTGLIAGVVAMALIGGGVAFAYWTTTGDGSGSATAGTTLEVDIDQDGTITGLFPDGPAAPIDFTINNPNAAPIRITTVGIQISAVTELPTATGPNACTAADFTVTQPSAINADIPVGDTAFPSTATGATIQMIDTGADQNRCKQAVVSLAFVTPAVP